MVQVGKSASTFGLAGRTRRSRRMDRPRSPHAVPLLGFLMPLATLAVDGGRLLCHVTASIACVRHPQSA